VLETRAKIEELQSSIHELKSAGRETERVLQREIWKLMDELNEVKEQKAAECKANQKRVTEESQNQAILAAANERTAQLYDETVRLRGEKGCLERDLRKARKSFLDGLQQVVELRAELLKLREGAEVTGSEPSQEDVVTDIAKPKIAALEDQNKKLVARNKEPRKIAVNIPKELVLRASELGADINSTREENIDLRSEIRQLQCKRESDKMQLSIIEKDVSDLHAMMNHRQSGVLPQRQIPQDGSRKKWPLRSDSAEFNELYVCRKFSPCAGGLSSRPKLHFKPEETELINMMSMVKKFDNASVSFYLRAEIKTFWMLYSKIQRTERYAVHDPRYGSNESLEWNRLMLEIRKTFEVIWTNGKEVASSVESDTRSSERWNWGSLNTNDDKSPTDYSSMNTPTFSYFPI
jgi:hypothetical protein